MTPHTSKLFEVYYDASHQSLRCVLMEEKRVMDYALRQLKARERNYPIHNLELEIMVFVLDLEELFICSVITRTSSTYSIRGS